MLPKNQKEFKPTADMIAAAQAVFVCMAMVQAIKPIVTGYQKDILERMQAHIAPDKITRGHTDEIILNPDHSYLLDDNDFKFYLEECRKEQARAGLKTEKPEFCPLLVAEDNQREAEHLLIETMEPITGITLHNLLCSSDSLKNLRKYLDLTLRLMAPYVKNPFEKVA